MTVRRSWLQYSENEKSLSVKYKILFEKIIILGG